jgi:hypothetical protein
MMVVALGGGLKAVANVGACVLLHGHWVRHPEYGVQLKVLHVEADTPESRQGAACVVSFL